MILAITELRGCPDRDKELNMMRQGEEYCRGEEYCKRYSGTETRQGGEYCVGYLGMPTWYIWLARLLEQQQRGNRPPCRICSGCCHNCPTHPNLPYRKQQTKNEREEGERKKLGQQRRNELRSLRSVGTGKETHPATPPRTSTNARHAAHHSTPRRYAKYTHIHTSNQCPPPPFFLVLHTTR